MAIPLKIGRTITGTPEAEQTLEMLGKKISSYIETESRRLAIADNSSKITAKHFLLAARLVVNIDPALIANYQNMTWEERYDAIKISPHPLPVPAAVVTNWPIHMTSEELCHAIKIGYLPCDMA